MLIFYISRQKVFRYSCYPVNCCKNHEDDWNPILSKVCENIHYSFIFAGPSLVKFSHSINFLLFIPEKVPRQIEFQQDIMFGIWYGTFAQGYNRVLKYYLHHDPQQSC